MLQKVTKDFIKTIDNRDNICYIIAISYRDYYFKSIIFTQTPNIVNCKSAVISLEWVK